MARDQADLAKAHNNLGRLLAREKRFAEAFTAIDAGLAIRKKLVEANPKTTEYGIHLGYSHAYRGWALVRAGQPSKAAADLRRAGELWSKDPAPDLQTRYQQDVHAVKVAAKIEGKHHLQKKRLEQNDENEPERFRGVADAGIPSGGRFSYPEAIR
jgi:tetratricopeptide (TPR) repeat protein